MKLFRIVRILLCILFLSGFFQHAVAATITPVSGTTSDTIAYGSIDNVIDGTIDYDEHIMLGQFGYNTWAGPYTVRFDLGQDYYLTAFNLWNNAGEIYNDGEGADDFELAFFNSAETPVGSSFSSNAADILTKQIFNIDVLNVRFVDFVIQSNHSIGTFNGPGGSSSERNYVDFYEANFDGIASSQVPVPGAMLLFGSSIIVLAGLRKKFKK